MKKMNNSVYEFIISLFWGINRSILTYLFFVFVFFSPSTSKFSLKFTDFTSAGGQMFLN